MMISPIIPLFFACDERYVPYLGVAVHSLIANASTERRYRIHVLNTGISPLSQDRIVTMARPHVEIVFVDMQEAILPFMSCLPLRDYYTLSIYFRLFIPAMFPQYDKAIYLDCDMVVEGDVAELFDIPLGNALLGAVRDQVVADSPLLTAYVEDAVGVDAHTYFNSGMLLMNLAGLREADIEGQFSSLIAQYNFPTVAPDQDYLNRLAFGRVKLLPSAWNTMYSKEPQMGPHYIIHFNMFDKPWLYEGVTHEERFWHYAKTSPFYPEICSIRDSYTDGDRARDADAGLAMLDQAESILLGDDSFVAHLGSLVKGRAVV